MINIEIKKMIKEKDVDTFKFLLRKNKFNINELNEILRYASLNRSFCIINILLRNKKINPNFMRNPISYASLNGHYDIVETLLKHPEINPENEAVRALTWVGFKTNVKHDAILKLLWTDKRIKNKAKIDNISLYNNINKFFINDKIISF